MLQRSAAEDTGGDGAAALDSIKHGSKPSWSSQTRTRSPRDLVKDAP
jgi:hypothetical protein